MAAKVQRYKVTMQIEVFVTADSVAEALEYAEVFIEDKFDGNNDFGYAWAKKAKRANV